MAPRPLLNQLPVPPGRYVLGADAQYGIPPLRIAFTVPTDGWVSWGPGVLTDEPDDRLHVGVSFQNVSNLYRDPCRWKSEGALAPAIGATVDDLVSGLGRLPHVRATAPVDVLLGGYPGKKIDLTIDSNLAFPGCDGGTVHFWIEAQGNSRYYQGPGQLEEFWIIDVHGVRLVVEGSSFPGRSTKNWTAFRQLLNSIQIER